MATKKVVDSIRDYLNSLGANEKPVVDKEAVRDLKAKIKNESDPIAKAKLYEALINEEQGHAPDLSGLRAVFIGSGKGWADTEGISADALLRMGVPEADLKEAGFENVTAGAKSKAAPARRSGGARAERLDLADVLAAAKKLDSPWRLSDLAAAIGREQATTRNYVLKLVEQGDVQDKGDDPKHSGRGKAAKLYSTKK